MHPSQCRSARVALGLSQEELGKLAGVTAMTVRRLEAGHGARALTLDKLRTAFAGRDVTFETRDGRHWIGFPEAAAGPFHGRSTRTRKKRPGTKAERRTVA